MSVGDWQMPNTIDIIAIMVGALSGATMAAKRGLDLTGVLALSFCTGLGGGLIRDLLLAQGTPVAFTNAWYLPTVVASAGIGLIFSQPLAKLTGVLLALDALCLGLFTVIGAQGAAQINLPAGSIIFIGVAAATGGSIIRDVLLGEPSAVMRPGPINAVAALVGASAYAALIVWSDTLVAVVVAVAVTTIIRLIALLTQWQAPQAANLVTELPWQQGRGGDPRTPMHVRARAPIK